MSIPASISCAFSNSIIFSAARITCAFSSGFLFQKMGMTITCTAVQRSNLVAEDCLLGLCALTLKTCVDYTGKIALQHQQPNLFVWKGQESFQMRSWSKTFAKHMTCTGLEGLCPVSSLPSKNLLVFALGCLAFVTSTFLFFGGGLL